MGFWERLGFKKGYALLNIERYVLEGNITISQKTIAAYAVRDLHIYLARLIKEKNPEIVRALKSGVEEIIVSERKKIKFDTAEKKEILERLRKIRDASHHHEYETIRLEIGKYIPGMDMELSKEPGANADIGDRAKLSPGWATKAQMKERRKQQAARTNQQKPGTK